MDMYSKLPVFTGPNMFPETQMAHYRDNIRPSMQYCGLSIVSKLMAWCEYIKEFDLKMKKAKMNSNLINVTHNVTENDLTPFKVAGCYDTYYCNVESLATINHSLMVVMSIVSLIGLIVNTFCFVKMHLKLNRNFVKNSFGIYLSTIIVFDCAKLALMIVLYIVPAMRSNQYREQLAMYQQFTFIIVPFLLPILDLSFTIVAWLIVAMLVQRSNITRAKLLTEAEGFGFVNVSCAADRRKTYCCLAWMVVALTVFVIPKFAEYSFNYDITTGKGIVIPLLRVFKLYRIIYLKFLSPSIECMIPIIVMLAYIAVIKYNEVLLTKNRHLLKCKIESKNADSETLLAYNSKVLSVTGISKKTQLVIWISVLILTDLLMKLSNIFVELERNLGGSPKEEWPRLRQITKYLSISISIITIALKPVIYIHCCPRLLTKTISRRSKIGM